MDKNIGNWKRGAVVRSKNYEKYGHITGLTRNSYGELIPIIHFEGEKDERGVHPANLVILKGEE